MNNIFRGLIAGYGAKKLGGGCFSTILIFILIYWALGNCNATTKRVPARPASVVKEQKVAANFKSDKMQFTSVYNRLNYPSIAGR